MLPLKYVRSLKQKQEQSEIMNRKQLKPDVRGADIWKSMEKYRTWEREDEVSLDFYSKYHNMAVPRKYPTTMPVAREKWETWSKVEGFKAPKETVMPKESHDFIPHPLAYDVSVDGTEENVTHDEDSELARHPFSTDYVKKNTAPSFVHSSYQFQNDNRYHDGEAFDYKATRKDDILDRGQSTNIKTETINTAIESY